MRHINDRQRRLKLLAATKKQQEAAPTRGKLRTSGTKKKILQKSHHRKVGGKGASEDSDCSSDYASSDASSSVEEEKPQPTTKARMKEQQKKHETVASSAAAKATAAEEKSTTVTKKTPPAQTQQTQPAEEGEDKANNASPASSSAVADQPLPNPLEAIWRRKLVVIKSGGNDNSSSSDNSSPAAGSKQSEKGAKSAAPSQQKQQQAGGTTTGNGGGVTMHMKTASWTARAAVNTKAKANRTTAAAVAADSAVAVAEAATTSPSDAVVVDRYDIAGTSNINELVLRHGTMVDKSDLKDTNTPMLFDRIVVQKKKINKNNNKNQKRGRDLEEDDSSAAAPPPAEDCTYLIDRYLSNAVRALVHPLHNFIQCHHGLHNADEIQIMLMPKDGPIAEADRTFQIKDKQQQNSGAKKNVKGKSNSKAVDSPPDNFRRCYVATNNESLTAEALARAVKDWGVAGVFQIHEFVLVNGPKGQHAEQKLLVHLRDVILGGGMNNNNSSKSGKKSFLSSAPIRLPPSLVADQKALVIGERLPCVMCRVFGVAFESMAVMLPSHGHMYTSTLPRDCPHCCGGSSSSVVPQTQKGGGNSGKGAASSAQCLHNDPEAIAALLLSHRYRRVLN